MPSAFSQFPAFPHHSSCPGSLSFPSFPSRNPEGIFPNSQPTKDESEQSEGLPGRRLQGHDNFKIDDVNQFPRNL